MNKPGVEKYLHLIQHDVDALGLLVGAARASKPPKNVSDWAITLHFYILCVYVKALGRCRGKDFQDHYSIREWLNEEKDLLFIARPYRKVEEWSRDARYEGRVFDPSEVGRFHKWFVEVRNGFVALLQKEGLSSVPAPDPISP